MQPLCIKCFGKGLCGRKTCPILSKLNIQKKVSFKKDFVGESPNIFVGRHGYPDLNVGILATDNYEHNDDPKFWVENRFSIGDIMEKRVSLVNSSFKTSVRSYKDKFLDVAKEISLSTKEADVEINLDDKPRFRVSFNNDVLPNGPRQDLVKASLTSNPKIPTAVDKVVSDTDFKATEAITSLHNKGFNEYYLTKAFSLGNLGTMPQRKIVPTRWSITATDDIIGKDIISKVKDFPENDSFIAYFGGLSGNYYLIMLLPGEFSYELFETYLPDSVWNSSSDVSFSTDSEDFFGRKGYANNTVGGYYAARLPVARKLLDMKRQGKALLLRFITPDYYAPLGVWYCRESVNDALSKRPIEFSSKELMLVYAANLVRKKFKYDIKDIVRVSRILSESQTKLSKFMA